MNRRAACQALCALLFGAFGTPVLAQRRRKQPLAWAELTAEQQEVLAPLKPDWESLEPERRRKWLGIAKRYPKMTPRGQERVQRRMQAWAKLTPEERQQARENYKRMAKASAEKRRRLREQWAEYQRRQPRRGAPSAPPQ